FDRPVEDLGNICQRFNLPLERSGTGIVIDDFPQLFMRSHIQDPEAAASDERVSHLKRALLLQPRNICNYFLVQRQGIIIPPRSRWQGPELYKILHEYPPCALREIQLVMTNTVYNKIPRNTITNRYPEPSTLNGYWRVTYTIFRPFRSKQSS